MTQRCNNCGVELIEKGNNTLCPICGSDTSQVKSEVEEPGYVG